MIRRSSTSLPADVARQAYDGLMANKRAVLPGLGIKIVPFLLRFFPRSFVLCGGLPFSAAQALKQGVTGVTDALARDLLTNICKSA